MQKTITSLTDIPAIAAYFTRIGAEPRSLRMGIVRELHGKYWRDIARIAISIETGDVRVFNNNDPNLPPTKDELKAIKEQIVDYRFPASKRVSHYEMPQHLKLAEKEDRLFVFKDQQGLLIMIVERREITDGKKVYHPWTLYEDDVWRNQEPDGLLPLYNLESLEARHTTVFIHEGPKAARAVHRLIHPYTDEEHKAFADHPWIKDLALPDVCHLGWHGGALNPYRTDWSVLKRHGIKRVFIVADNDRYGLDATPRIARQLEGMKVMAIHFDKRFKNGFDLADPFEEHLYETRNGNRIYKGPTFDEMLVPATWATEEIPSLDKKKQYRLREEFVEQWYHCVKQNLYVNYDRPGVQFTEQQFEDKVKPYARGVKNVSSMLKEIVSAQCSGITYRPDQPNSRILSEENLPRAFNIYVAPKLQSVDGDPKPWFDYLEHLIVRDDERHQVMRWCATLIAKPEVRMGYSLLLISTRHGTGKTTLGAQVLSPLVGKNNTSFPDEKVIVDSSFNAWVADKRLVIISEIYPGGSWKTYQSLKAYVSDDDMEVHKKYMNPYSARCFSHFVCSSNFLRAMKIDNTDRRWYIPEVAEDYWGGDIETHGHNFAKFRHWLTFENGLGIIKHWAENFNDYVSAGVHPPNTKRKTEMIEEARSSPEKTLRSWAEANCTEAVVALDREIINLLKSHGEDPKYFTPRELRKVLEDMGWKNPGFSITFNGMTQSMVMSPHLYRDWINLNGASPQEQRDWIRARIKSPLIDPNVRSM